MMKKIFIITGDYSGDIHAANVVKMLKTLNSDIVIEGIGGENLKAQGVNLFVDQKKLGAAGISPKILIEHFLLGVRVVNYLKNEYKPDLVLLIDYGGFNLGISKYLKHAGIKLYYYIPPQVWASRKWRINKIKKYIDKVLCIFPFEKTMYEKHGIKTHYVGHPLISQLPPKADRIALFKKHGLNADKKLVSVFPGSRVFELKQLMDIFVKAINDLKKKHPDLQFCISQAPNLDDTVYNKFLKSADVKVIKGENQALLSVSDALILASGTVALEAALYGTPMIIAYRGPWILYFVYLLVRCIKRVSLPNIIADKDIVPEIIQNNVNVNNISYETEKILFDAEYRKNYTEQLAGIKALLSDKNAAKEVAEEIFKLSV